MSFAKFDAEKIMVPETRTSFLSGVGTPITSATSLETALALSGLDYSVNKTEVQYMTKIPGKPPKYTKVPDQFVTYRDDTKEFLGIVGKNYNILQNIDAFNFLDSLIVGETRFETAGSFGKNNARSFISISTDTIKLLDDDIQPYIVITNSFDGSGCVQVYFCPQRVFCSNTLARNKKNSQNYVRIKHSNLLAARMEQAKEMLLANTNYLEALKISAEKLAVTPFSAENFEAMARELFPVKTEDSEIVQVRNMEMVEYLLHCYKQDDLANFNNTAWKAVQAVADYDSHTPTTKKSRNMNMKDFNNVIITGMPLLNLVWDRMEALAK